MKKTIKFILVFTAAFLLMQACVMDREYVYYLKNKSNYSVSVLQLSKAQIWEHVFSYPDTIIPKEAVFNPWNVAKNYEKAIFWTQSTKLQNFMEREKIDTVCVFVFKTEVLEQFSWDSIRSNYLVLQRYDLSYEDVANSNYEICFPPSEAMKHIHMWPPYGTYDENGNQNKKLRKSILSAQTR